MTFRPPVPSRPLKPLELDVVRCCGEGMSFREIGVACRITPRMAKWYVHHIARALPGEREPYLRVVRYGVTVLMAEHQAREAASPHPRFVVRQDNAA